MTSILAWASAQYVHLRVALSDQPLPMRVMTLFYLAGPFFMLIERSPADAWLTLCGLCFLVHCIRQRHWQWLQFFWVRAIGIFWLFCLFSAAVSTQPAHALGEALAWIRFPLFACASCFWLAKDRRILTAMFIALGIGVMVMSGILLAEFVLIGQDAYGRLSWPYGDLVPGNFLAKAGLPVFCILIALAMSAPNHIAAPSALLFLFTFVMSILTGERINFIIRAASAMLAGLVYRPKWTRYIWLIVIEVTVILAVVSLSPAMKAKYINRFIAKLPFSPANLPFSSDSLYAREVQGASNAHDSPYLRAWNGAIDAFQTSPLIGIGPDNYRLLCPQISAGQADVDCHTQPHNFYLQLLGETGLIGFCLGCVMMGAIFWRCVRIGLDHRAHIACATCFIMPLAFFFPIQSTADFFGQWNNSFMWSALALSLACTNFKSPPAPSPLR